MSLNNRKPALLALEDGRVFRGRSWAADGESCGEMVFNTSMTGYQEVLTDPSYKGQIVTMTYPLIGNYGVNREDVESSRPQVEGFIVRELARLPSNFRTRHKRVRALSAAISSARSCRRAPSSGAKASPAPSSRTCPVVRPRITSSPSTSA
jgi:carbamoylphosphate synthase small subunit